MPINRNDAVPQIAMFIIAVCSVMMGIGRTMGNVVLRLLTVLIRWSFRVTSDNPTTKQQWILDQMPSTIETVLKRFNLEGKTTTYAVCPSCHCTYEPLILEGSDTAKYPAVCDNQPQPDSPLCGAALLDEDAKPVKIFLYHSFHDFLGRLLSDAVLEKMMDDACDDLMTSIKNGEPIPVLVTDVFGAEFVRTFKGPDGKKLFIDRPSNGSRYLFAFSFDFFSAEGQTIRGASASCGIISATCLNIPPLIRTKAEYMYIAGVIPGPEEPHLDELNHYMRPVFKDVAVAWDRRVHYSRTANYPSGKDTNSAMALAVNDLPAARKFSQCAGHSSNHFCSRCHLFGLPQTGRTDTESVDWKLKDADDMRQKAEAWKNASTQEKRDELFKKHGMRWSEVWRLPYWDPAKMLVVDSMHCLLEGLAQYHFRFVLQLTDKSAETKHPDPPPYEFSFALPNDTTIRELTLSEKDQKDIGTIHRYLLAPISGSNASEIQESFLALQKRLEKLHWNSLKFVFTSLGLKPRIPAGAAQVGIQPRRTGRISCAGYAEALTDWVCVLCFH